MLAEAEPLEKEPRRGPAIDITGGMDSVEYVRRMRAPKKEAKP